MAEQGKEKAAEAGKVDMKAIEAKLDKNEPLTKEEERVLLENEPAPADYANQGDQGENPDEWVKEQKEGKPESSEEDAGGEDNEKEGKPKEETPHDDTKVDMLKIEEMLAVPEGKEDLTGMTKREQAYYWRMRKEQRRAAKAEEDRDAARFELSKVKKAPDAQDKDKKDPEPAAEDDDPFKGKDPTDFLTVADAEKILAKALKAREKAAADQAPAKTTGIMDNPIVASYVKRCDEEMTASVADYDEVMELTEEIIATNPAHQKAVAEALMSGGNPARTMYELIKADPDFAKLLPAAQVRALARKNKKSDTGTTGALPKGKSAEDQKKEAEARKAEEILENNNKKPKTSGHAEGKDKIEAGDHTMEQIAQMSDREFRALPKRVRARYLELYG